MMRRDQLVAVVNLYKALSGGWQPGEQVATLRAMRGAALSFGGAVSLPTQRQTDKRP
jgi:hypothetical protein